MPKPKQSNYTTHSSDSSRRWICCRRGTVNSYKQAYRDEIVANAKDTQLGLMTTWDLFRLLRNVERLKWPAHVVMPIFYRIGRIEPIPDHYRELGRVAKVWEKAFGVVPAEVVSVGDRLAIEDGDGFEEISVTSLKVDNVATQTAGPGSNCGVACESGSKRFREKARVFKILAIAQSVIS